MSWIINYESLSFEGRVASQRRVINGAQITIINRLPPAWVSLPSEDELLVMPTMTGVIDKVSQA